MRRLSCRGTQPGRISFVRPRNGSRGLAPATGQRQRREAPALWPARAQRMLRGRAWRELRIAHPLHRATSFGDVEQLPSERPRLSMRQLMAAGCPRGGDVEWARRNGAGSRPATWNGAVTTVPAASPARRPAPADWAGAATRAPRGVDGAATTAPTIGRRARDSGPAVVKRRRDRPAPAAHGAARRTSPPGAAVTGQEPCMGARDPLAGSVRYAVSGGISSCRASPAWRSARSAEGCGRPRERTSPAPFLVPISLPLPSLGRRPRCSGTTPQGAIEAARKKRCHVCRILISSL